MINNAKPVHASANMAREQLKRDDDHDDNDKNKRKITPTTSPWVYCALVLFIIISYVAMPEPLQPPQGKPSERHVFYYGWLTAISTGLGAIPLVFAPNLASYWVGISNGTLTLPVNVFILFLSKSSSFFLI